MLEIFFSSFCKQNYVLHFIFASRFGFLVSSFFLAFLGFSGFSEWLRYPRGVLNIDHPVPLSQTHRRDDSPRVDTCCVNPFFFDLHVSFCKSFFSQKILQFFFLVNLFTCSTIFPILIIVKNDWMTALLEIHAFCLRQSYYQFLIIHRKI